MYKMQFCNFRMALFVFPSQIPHSSFLVCSFHLLPSRFGALVPANGTFSAMLLLCLRFSFADAVSPLLFSIGSFQSEVWPCVVQLSEMVLGAVCEVQCGAAFQEGIPARVGGWGPCRCLSQREQLSWDWEELVPSEVAVPEMCLQSYSNSYLPVFYFQSSFMVFFYSSIHTSFWIFCSLCLCLPCPWSYECTFCCWLNMTLEYVFFLI